MFVGYIRGTRIDKKDYLILCKNLVTLLEGKDNVMRYRSLIEKIKNITIEDKIRFNIYNITNALEICNIDLVIEGIPKRLRTDNSWGIIGKEIVDEDEYYNGLDVTKLQTETNFNDDEIINNLNSLGIPIRGLNTYIYYDRR